MVIVLSREILLSLQVLQTSREVSAISCPEVGDIGLSPSQIQNLSSLPAELLPVPRDQLFLCSSV